LLALGLVSGVWNEVRKKEVTPNPSLLLMFSECLIIANIHKYHPCITETINIIKKNNGLAQIQKPILYTRHQLQKRNDKNHIARFEVLILVTMKSTIFCNVTPCSLAGVHWHFRGTYCLHHQSQKVGWASKGKQTCHLPLVNSYKKKSHSTKQHPSVTTLFSSPSFSLSPRLPC
jgi:hypothetical protein